MGWRDNRRRSICRKIMFTPEEWEQARRIHERWARNIPVYRRWGDFARQTLMHGALMNVSARRIARRTRHAALGRWKHAASDVQQPSHARNVHRHAHGPVEQVRGPFRHRHAVGGVWTPEAARRIVGKRRFHDAQTLCDESRAIPLLPSAGKEIRRAEDDGRGVERGVQTPARERWRPGRGTA